MSLPPGHIAVPKIWNRTECFVLGGGPSMPPADELERLRGHSHTIAVNNAYKVAMWADVHYFGDRHWPKQHGQQLVDFAGLKFTTARGHLNTPGILTVEKQNSPYGVSKDARRVCWNISSGACAVGLAAQLGAGRIVLLGFDMRSRPTCRECGAVLDGPRPCAHGKQENREHFHRDYNHGRRGDVYKRFLKSFPSIAKDLKAMNVECVNACIGSALDVFPIVDWVDVLPKEEAIHAT